MNFLSSTTQSKGYAALFQPIYQQFHLGYTEIDSHFIQAIHSALDTAKSIGEITLIETNVVHCFIASGNPISKQTSEYVGNIFEHSQQKKEQFGGVYPSAFNSVKQFRSRAISVL